MFFCRDGVAYQAGRCSAPPGRSIAPTIVRSPAAEPVSRFSPFRFLWVDMRILLSNDDGYFSPGIECLARVLADVADITVVAPERDRSGASKLAYAGSATVASSAPPTATTTSTVRQTDCVHLAVTGDVSTSLPDMVRFRHQSRCQHGRRHDLFWNRRGGLPRGFLLGVPSLAVSLCSKGRCPFRDGRRVLPWSWFRCCNCRKCGHLCCSTSTCPMCLMRNCAARLSPRLGKRHKAGGGCTYRDARRNETVLLGWGRPERRRMPGKARTSMR